MIIQNKKTGERKELTEAQYQTLKQIGFASQWNILTRDAPLAEPKVIPMEITSFAQIEKPTKKKQHGRRSKDS